MNLSTEPSASTAIKVTDLHKDYRRGLRGKHADADTSGAAVAGVSLEVRTGELMVLLGPSGCGKTTLLRCIAGLEQPDGGEIRIGPAIAYSSANQVSLPPEKRRLGMMFQSYALWPHKTVKENVAYPLRRRHTVPKTKINDTVEHQLDILEIGGLGARYPGELSGGQQQRVALARALVGGTDIVLFDEPLSNVDATVRRRLRRMLRRLKDEIGFSGIYVTHDQEEAMELADMLAVMRDGVIEQVGSPREIYRTPASFYVADFVGGGVVNRWDATVTHVDDRTIRLSSPIGNIDVVRRGAPPAVGDTGTLAVRPECVRVGPLDATTASSVKAVVTDQVYFGSRVEYHLMVGETPVVASMDASWDAQTAAGDTIMLAFDAENTLWLAR